MKLTTSWKGKMLFESSDGAHAAAMDAKSPIGGDSALSPKQLCLAAITGCTAMDVVSLLRKTRKEMHAFRIDADAPVTERYPAVFREVVLDFHLEGDFTVDEATNAVHLSQTKYCGVSAMIAKACPIRYRVHLNGALVHEGIAKFEF